MEMISASSFFGTTAGRSVCERVTGVKVVLDNGAVVFDKETGVMAIILDIGGDISGVAFTVDVSDTGTGRVVFDKETGVMVIVLTNGGVAFTVDTLDTGGLVFDGETDVMVFDGETDVMVFVLKTGRLVCDKETEEMVFA